jgi:alkanesulfonate monooxygenase SsuD/methylene tetrahydromethanopterin reductase-like flavin-dependent oxidoreductase (luciferase family)
MSIIIEGLKPGYNAGYDDVMSPIQMEHYYSDNRTTPNPAVMAAAVAERCKRVRSALLGQLLPLNHPVRATEEIGMLGTLTGGRVVVAFMRGSLSEEF